MSAADDASNSDASQATVPHANTDNRGSIRPLGVNNRQTNGTTTNMKQQAPIKQPVKSRVSSLRGGQSARGRKEKANAVAAKDKEILHLLVKLKKCEKDNVKRQHDLLNRIRIMLQERVDDMKEKSPLLQEKDLAVGPTVVELMRQKFPEEQAEEIMEEATCILYFVSVTDPNYKKGIARLFKAMQEHLQNVAIQKASLAAIFNIVSANPDSIPRIAPSLPGILKTMDTHPQNTNVLTAALQVLGEIAKCSETKPFFVSAGALLKTFQTMKDHVDDPKLQVTAYQTLSGLSKDSSSKTKRQMVPAIALIIHGLRLHSEDKETQLHGIQALGNLMPPADLTDTVVSIVCIGLEDWPEEAEIQEAGFLALCHIILHCPFEILVDMAITETGFMTTTVKGMTSFPSNLGVQYQGLRVLVHLSSRMADNMGKHVQEFRQVHERLMSENGLDATLKAMETFGKSHALVAQIGCELLVNVSRNSQDFQKAIWAKGGISLLLGCMRRHVQNLRVQDLGCCALRNICLNRDNRLPVQDQGGVSTLLVTMDFYVANDTIQTYACDALGRMAMDEVCRPEIVKERGIEAAMNTLKKHTTNPAVQDRAVFLLLNLTLSPNALKKMVDLEVLPLVLEAKVPPKKQATDRWSVLIQRLEKAQPFRVVKYLRGK